LSFDLSEAEAVLARGQRHYEEFNRAVHGEGLTKLWSISENFDRASGEWRYAVSLNRRRLELAKPILADAATNTISALDHVVAAVAKARNAKRRGLYFPTMCDTKFDAELRELRKRLGDDIAMAIERLRTEYRDQIPYVLAVREMANSGKHWELPVSDGALMGITLNFSGRALGFDVPPGAFRERDSFEYYRGAAKLPDVAHNLVVRMEIRGLPDELPNLLEGAFQNSFYFAKSAIDAVKRAAAQPPLPPSSRTADSGTDELRPVAE
jgi:hypothetical protein